MNQFEHAEQVTLMQWWQLVHKQFGIPEQLLFAIPNGGLRNIIVAKRLKAEGVRSGVPDIFLAYPSRRRCGLFIEMKKVKGGRVSGNQKSLMEDLNKSGYLAVVCHGWTEAKAAIERYLRDREEI